MDDKTLLLLDTIGDIKYYYQKQRANLMQVPTEGGDALVNDAILKTAYVTTQWIEAAMGKRWLEYLRAPDEEGMDNEDHIDRILDKIEAQNKERAQSMRAGGPKDPSYVKKPGEA